LGHSWGAAVVKAWDHLPESVRAGIVAEVRAAKAC